MQGLSNFTAQRIAELYGPGAAHKTVVAPGWVDDERFRPHADVTAIRSTLGPAWQTAAPVFFTVRRLEPRMGLEQLIEAAKILRARNEPFRLMIGGSGSLESRLQQLVHDAGLKSSVFLLGRLSDEDLPRSFAAADCFVLPTRSG